MIFAGRVRVKTQKNRDVCEGSFFIIIDELPCQKLSVFTVGVSHLLAP